MKGLTTALLARACGIFYLKAYPNGEHTIPLPKRLYLNLSPDQPVEELLGPPLCQCISDPNGGIRGYAIRLGSVTYPHLKMQIVDCDNGAALVLAVDTHDTLRLDPTHPDAAGWARLQAANRKLKEEIECAWDAEGLLTFNGLLRRGLDRS